MMSSNSPSHVPMSNNSPFFLASNALFSEFPFSFSLLVLFGCNEDIAYFKYGVWEKETLFCLVFVHMCALCVFCVSFALFEKISKNP